VRSDLAGVVAFLGTLGLLPCVRRVLIRRSVLDIPNERSSHGRSVPRGGGIAVAAAVTGALIAVMPAHTTSSYWLLLIVPVGMFAVGLADDLISTSPFVRLAAEATLTLPVLAFGVFRSDGRPIMTVVALAAGTVWLVGFVNAFNFMDGVNGLAAVAAGVGGAAYIVVGTRSGDRILVTGGAVAVGGALAFLPFNFPTASLFLGDSGSYFWGASLAALALLTLRDRLRVETAFGPLVPFVLDASLTLVRRVSAGECWYASHRDHLYERLLRSGWSHTRVTAFLGGLMLVCAGPAW
jgi:UDP-GlcNAc:undecaprenyl-phosphate/decaprenyl-phosphate GlcNAc-1-phosphate transferase